MAKKLAKKENITKELNRIFKVKLIYQLAFFMILLCISFGIVCYFKFTVKSPLENLIHSFILMGLPPLLVAGSFYLIFNADYTYTGQHRINLTIVLASIPLPYIYKALNLSGSTWLIITMLVTLPITIVALSFFTYIPAKYLRPQDRKHDRKMRRHIWTYHRIRQILFVYALLTTITLSALIGWIIDSYSIEISKERAIPIITALDNYRRDHGAYPALLEDLIPGHLPQLPKTFIGIRGRYFYQFDPENNYKIILSFETNSQGICQYHFFSEDRFWTCHNL